MTGEVTWSGVMVQDAWVHPGRRNVPTASGARCERIEGPDMIGAVKGVTGRWTGLDGFVDEADVA